MTRNHQAAATGATTSESHMTALLTEQQLLSTLVAVMGIVFYLFFTSWTNYHISLYIFW
jgi:predicted RND superfamily exporter protein